MEGSKTCYSEEEIEQLLSAAENLQDENEHLISEIEELRNRNQQQEQRHSSETQELMSQISLMRSAIAETKRALQQRDAEIVSLNARLEKNAESDLVWKENCELKERVQEVMISSDKEMKRAKRMLAEAKEANRIAEKKQSDFKIHLRIEGEHIRKKVLREAEQRYKDMLAREEEKMGAWTNAIAVAYLVLLFTVVLMLGLFEDVAVWIGGIISIVGGFFLGCLNECAAACDEWSSAIGNVVVAYIVLTLILILVYVIVIAIVVVIIVYIWRIWSEMWSPPANETDKAVQSAHIFGLLSVQGTIAMVLSQILPSPFDFNFMNWWIILFLATVFGYRYITNRDNR